MSYNIWKPYLFFNNSFFSTLRLHAKKSKSYIFNKKKPKSRHWTKFEWKSVKRFVEQNRKYVIWLVHRINRSTFELRVNYPNWNFVALIHSITICEYGSRTMEWMHSIVICKKHMLVIKLDCQPRPKWLAIYVAIKVCVRVHVLLLSLSTRYVAIWIKIR